MTIKIFTLGQGKHVHGVQLADEISDDTTANIDVDDITRIERDGNVLLKINDIPDGQETATQATIDAHVPEEFYTVDDKQAEQRRIATENVRGLFQGLALEDPADAAYIAYGRSVAKISGENNSTILAIDTRAKAIQYVTDTTEWQALPASAKTWLTLDKQANMLMWQALIAFSI